MNAKQKLHNARLQEWATRCSDQKSSGLNVRQWCEENHVSFHAFNYWKHLLKEEAVERLLPDIVPVQIPSSQPIQQAHTVTSTNCTIRTNRAIHANPYGIRIKINDVAIEVDSDIPEPLLIALVKAVRYA